MRHLRIAVIPGDGIGREVVPVAVGLVGRAVELGASAAIEFDTFPWSCEYYLREGRMMPEDGLETLRPYDAIFLGAVGDPRLVPDHVSLWGLLIRIRRGFHQALNLRPARYFAGMPSPLRDPRAFDLLVVRENSEGEYSQIGGTIFEDEREVAVQVSVFTRTNVERAIRYAFEAARGRRRSVTSATKSNGIVHTMPFWDRVFRETAVEYADVAAASMHLDALLARLVLDPGAFDVIVGSNLFGDLLTDLAGALMGGIGLAPAANIDPDRRYPAMFEPVHGSAPDIAGRGIANPLGQVWTGVLMLEHLGLAPEAARLLDAVRRVIRDGDVTRDIGGSLNTAEVGDRLRRALG